MSSMFTDDELAEDRAEFNTLLTDTCRIIRFLPVSDDPEDREWNETTMKYEADRPTAVVYEGPCRMQVKVDINSNVVEATAGDHEFTYLTSQLQVPVEATEDDRIVAGNPADITVDDLCEMLSAQYDSSLPGRQFNIAGPYRKSQATYRRFRVREVVG